MKNIKELRESLLSNYEAMKQGDMEIKLGKELANTAGKVLGTVKIELEYNAMFDNRRRIDFLDE